MRNEITNQTDIAATIASYKNKKLCIKGDSTLTASSCQISNMTNSENMVTLFTPLLSLYGSQAPLPNYLNDSISKAEDLKPYFDIIQNLFIFLYSDLNKKVSSINVNISHKHQTNVTSIFSRIFSTTEQIEANIRNYCGFPVKITGHVARWSAIANPTLLQSETSNRLGDTTSIGEYIYTARHSHIITIGPLTPIEYREIILHNKMESLETALKQCFSEGCYRIKLKVSAWSLRLSPDPTLFLRT
jgi:predicted component of type VI protein secretion system